MEEMISALTRGIGRELSISVRNTYYVLRDSLRGSAAFGKMSAAKRAFAFDLVALAAFNSHVVIPLRGSAAFMRANLRIGIKKVRMSDYDLDQEFSQSAERIGKAFFAILRKHRIEIRQLYFESPDELVNRIEHWTFTDAGDQEIND